MRRFIWLVALTLSVISCRSTRNMGGSIDVKHENEYVAGYASKYAGIAIEEMQRTGIPASITLAQGIIESDYGRSRLATRANNHFGIKCHSDWKGATIRHDDDRRNECFRSYGSAEESFRDHSDFLTGGARYSFLFELKTDDYKGWARGLKKAGYATNPRYANMLINTIEENELWQYDRLSRSTARRDDRRVINDSDPVPETRDRGILVNTSASRILERNRIQYIIVREGDTYRSLAEEFDLLSWEIFRYNDLPDDAVLVPGQLVYIQPKRNRAEPGSDFHIVKEGETMYTISQLYGIKLKTLYERNGLKPGVSPPPGTELWLRKTKPDGL